MVKVIFVVLVAFSSVFGISINQGWNLLGAKGDLRVGDFVSNEIERVFLYDDGSWSVYTISQRDDVIPSGRGFWYYSSTFWDYEPPLENGNDYDLVVGWNLVSPNETTWDLRDFSSIVYGWKYQNQEWLLYSKNSTARDFSSVEFGEGVWLYNEPNMLIGNTSLNVSNGNFGTINKSVINSTNTTELIDGIKNIYDFTFKLNNGIVLDNFRVGIKVTRGSSEYFYFVTVNSTNLVANPPLVELLKADGSRLGTRQVEAPVIEFLDGGEKFKLNFHKIVKYLIPNYYSYEEMRDRFGNTGDLRYEIYGYNIPFNGASILTENVTVNRYIFPAGSSKISGTLRIR